MARVAIGPIPSAYAQPIPPRDRRAGARQPLEALGVLSETDGDDKQLEVAVLNVSPHGCAFRSPVAFRPGAIYTMRIGTGPLYLASTLRIVSSRDRCDGFFEVGAKFV
ncbi:MAG: hypothetical protein QOF78_2115 [Phycisphaerales bacterium]|jgi:hypothetical protein|nr:hypothetical protein [Phycisphaerales bacterium]